MANDRTATTVRNFIDTAKQNRREDDDLLDCGIKIDNDDGYTCNLRDSSLGTPTILISLGRSGSSATWPIYLTIYLTNRYMGNVGSGNYYALINITIDNAETMDSRRWLVYTALNGSHIL